MTCLVTHRYMCWVLDRADPEAHYEFSGHLSSRNYFDYCWMIIATVTTAGYGNCSILIALSARTPPLFCLVCYVIALASTVMTLSASHCLCVREIGDIYPVTNGSRIITVCAMVLGESQWHCLPLIDYTHFLTTTRCLFLDWCTI